MTGVQTCALPICLHRLRQRRRRGLPGLARAADERALGGGRPVGLRRHGRAKDQRFWDTAVVLKKRIELMLALPLSSRDEMAIQREIKDIGTR